MSNRDSFDKVVSHQYQKCRVETYWLLKWMLLFPLFLCLNKNI